VQTSIVLITTISLLKNSQHSLRELYMVISLDGFSLQACPMGNQYEFKKGAILSLVLSRSPGVIFITPLLADDMTLFITALEILILLRRLIFGGRLIYDAIIHLSNHEVEKGERIPF